MAIEVECGSCGKSYRLPDDKAGRKFRCRDCEAVIAVPAADAGSPWRVVADTDDDDDLPPPPRTGRSAGGKAPKPGARSAAKGSTKPKQAGGSKSGSRAPLVVGLVAGVVLLVGSGIAAYFLMRGGNGVPEGEAPAGKGPTVVSNPIDGGETGAGPDAARPTGTTGATESSPKSATTPGSGASPAQPAGEPASAKKSFAALQTAARARDWPRFFEHFSPGTRQFVGTGLVQSVLQGVKAAPEKESATAAELATAGIDLGQLKSLPLPTGSLKAVKSEVYAFSPPLLAALMGTVVKLDPTMLEFGNMFAGESAWLEDGPDRAVVLLAHEDPGGKTKGRRRDEQPFVLLPIDGRWLVDMEASEEIRRKGTRSVGKAPPPEVKTVSIDQSDPRKAFESYLAAVRGRDWKHRLECVDPGSRVDHVTPLLLNFNVQDVYSATPVYPEESGALRALFERHGLKRPELEELVIQGGRGVTERVFGKIADLPAFYAELHAVWLKQDPRHDLEIVERTAQDAVVAVDVQEDLATVVVRAPKIDPRSIGGTQFHRMTRNDGRWFYMGRSGEADLTREFMRKHVAPEPRLQRTIPSPDRHSLQAILALPGGPFVAGGGSDEAVTYWDVESGERKGSIAFPKGDVYALALSPDGKTMAVAVNGDLANEKYLVLVPTGGTDILRRCEGRTGYQSGRTSRIAFAPDGRHVVGSCFHDHLMRIWDVESGKLVEWKSDDNVRDVGFAADAARILGLASGSVQVWNRTGGPPVEQRPVRPKLGSGSSGFARALAVSPDRTRIAIAVQKELVLWDGKTLAEIRRWDTGHESDPSALAWSPDGRTLVSAALEVKVWRADGGELAETLYGAWRSINDLTFTADGRRLATCDEGGDINVFSVP